MHPFLPFIEGYAPSKGHSGDWLSQGFHLREIEVIILWVKIFSEVGVHEIEEHLVDNIRNHHIIFWILLLKCFDGVPFFFMFVQFFEHWSAEGFEGEL